jgi:hypothetical protein
MRLSDVLSKSHNPTPAQVEGFLGDRRLKWGKHKRIQIGRVVRNYHCRQCNDQRSFVSGDELYCLGLGERALSVDATLRCTACDASVEVWFLLESEDEIAGVAPVVRVERCTENLRDRADRIGDLTGPFGDLVKCARLAHDARLGAGSMVYIRQLFESITYQVAEIAGIATIGLKGGRRQFKGVLREVNEQRSIIPQQYASEGYKLFSELSEVIHGSSSEDEALRKFQPCLQLVLGVVEEVNRDSVFSQAIDALGWSVENIEEVAESAGP